MKRRVAKRRLSSPRETSETLAELIEQQIFLLRSQRVMLSTTLAGL